jgi:predicted DNA-binding transcriptional regulator AlpA
VTEGLRELGLMTEAELAAMVGNDVHTLKNWRSQRSGPRFVKLGRRTFYRLESFRAWLASHVVTGD